MLTGISLYGYAREFLSVHLLMAIWVFSILELLWIKVWWIYVNMSLCGYMFSFLLGKHLGIEFFSQMVNIYLTLYLKKTKQQNPAQTSLKWQYHFILHHLHVRVTVAQNLHHHLVWSVFWILAIIVVWSLPVVIICISIMTIIWVPFHVLIWPFIYQGSYFYLLWLSASLCAINGDEPSYHSSKGR